MFRPFFLSLCFLAPAFLFAQAELDTSSFQLKKLRKELAVGGYFNVIQEAKAITKQFPTLNEAQFLLGKAYYESRNYEEAIPALESSLNPRLKTNHRTQFLLADCYYRVGEYRKSAKALGEYLAKKDLKDPNFKNNAPALQKCLENINALDTAYEQYEWDSTFAFPNSGYADFGYIQQDPNAFIFSSLREDSVVMHNPGKANFHTTRLFRQTVNEKEFDKLEDLKSLNAFGFHTGNGCFSPDKSKFYFTRCFDTRSGTLQCAIYVADYKAGKFKNVHKLDESINKPGSSNSQPFVIETPSGKTKQTTLYFISDRKGGSGGGDIWYAIYNAKKEVFGNAVNAGKTINTPLDEKSPYVLPDEKLIFFSSNGHPSWGGFDVFMAEGNYNRYSQPKNVGVPVNSAADDVYFVPERSGKLAYLSSNRPGGEMLSGTHCCEDVFRFKRLDPPRKRYTKRPKVEEIPELAAIQANTKNLSTKSAPTKPVSIDTVKFTQADLQKNDSKGADEKSTRFLRRVSQNIRFELGSDQLSDASIAHLDSLVDFLAEKEKYKVRLFGHTDNKGKEALNQKIAKARAETVKNALVARGIEAKKIATVAKGSSQPLFPNSFPDGKDNPINRAKNRRVTIEVSEK